MAAGDLITEDWQAEFNGLLMGEGTAYSIVQIDGLLSHPEVRTGDQERLRIDGVRPGDDFLGGRTVVLTVEVYGATDTEFRTAVNALKQAFRPGQSEAPLVFQLPGVADGGKIRVNARARRAEWPVGRDVYYRLSEVPIELFSTDPRLFDNDLSVGATTLPTASGGLTFPATPPFSFGSVGTGGTISVVNTGTYKTPIAFRIDGPVQDPRIINDTVGKELKLTTTIATGDYVIIDTATRTVLLNGTADRYYLLTSADWFDLEPGTNNISFRGATSAAGSLSATWRSAWV